MNTDLPSEPSSSAFEDFLSGKPTDAPVAGEATVVTPPAADDGESLARIVANIRAELIRQVRSETNEVLPAGMTVRAHGNVGEFFYLPDVIVDADLPPVGSTSARHPLVIVEVAAGGSERAGFIEQWQIYRSLPTLAVYVLVDATLTAVTVFRRAGQTWKTETYEDTDDQFLLPPIHGLLSLETIYAEKRSDDADDQDPFSSEPKITLS